MSVRPGKYLARPFDWGVGKTKAGLPQIFVKFGFVDNEKTAQELTWFGTLKEGKGREITLKALLNCGLRGNDLSVLADGQSANALDGQIEVEIDVIQETNDSGSTFTKIQWVNKPGDGGFRNLTPPAEGKALLKTMNLAGDIAALRKELGAPTKPPVKKNEPPPFDSDDDIPF